MWEVYDIYILSIYSLSKGYAHKIKILALWSPSYLPYNFIPPTIVPYRIPQLKISL